MAFIGNNDDKLNQGQNQGQPGQTGAQVTSGGGGLVSSGGGLGNPGGGAQAGSGGTQGWTNIQSYLDANKGNDSSAKMLQDKIGSQFDQEEKQLQGQAQDTTKTAQAEADKTNIGKDQASQLIADAGKNYQYQPTDPSAQRVEQNDTYQQDVGKLKGALNAQYGGPTQFNYGFGQQTQDYGNNLGSDRGFSAIMNGLYTQAAPSGISGGQLALQNQLDTNNQAVQDARNSMNQRYQGLQGELGSTLKDTNAALQNAQTQFGQNQQALKGNLTGMRDQDLTSLDSAVAQAKAQDQAQAAKYDPSAQYAFHANGNTINPDSAWAQQMINGGYAHYQGADINRSTAGVGDDPRRQYNAILEALGMNTGAIQAAAPAAPGPRNYSYTGDDISRLLQDQHPNGFQF